MLIKSKDMDKQKLKRLLNKYKTIKYENYVITDYSGYGLTMYRLFNITKKDEVIYNNLEMLIKDLNINKQISFL
jgi:hypothetical protein